MYMLLLIGQHLQYDVEYSTATAATQTWSNLPAAEVVLVLDGDRDQRAPSCFVYRLLPWLQQTQPRPLIQLSHGLYVCVFLFCIFPLLTCR